MGRVNSYTNVTRADKTDEILIDGSAGTRNMTLGDLAIELQGMTSAIHHRNIFRGKSLGTSVTDAQKKAIKDGTFNDLYIGDYWYLNNIVWRIVDMDYWLSTGDSSCATHHLVIISDAILYNHIMNDTNVTTGAYKGSKMYQEGLEQAKTMINTAFGEANILKHREYLTTAVTNGHASAGEWTDSTVELPNEIMIYGCTVFTPTNDGVTIPANYTIDKTQLAGMRLNPQLMQKSRQNYWLRDVVSASHFAGVDYRGRAYCFGASNAIGVRPVFGVTGGN